MDEPRPEKVAVVEEVRERLSSSKAILVTEYRGIDVGGMATLRRSLTEAGGQYKVYKNTLVRLATRELGLELDDLFTGPTAIAFVPEDSDADPVTVAKALKTFGKDNPNLVMKGGLLGERLLSSEDASALADIASREELLARLARDLAAPMQKFATLLQALPQNLAYGLQALVDQQGGAPAAPEAPAESADEPPAEAAEEPPDDAGDEPAEAAEPAATETPADDAGDDTDRSSGESEDASTEES